MIIEVGEVPDSALEALIEAMPDDQEHARAHREEWRQALAAALTA